jgi:hypothetical protein
MPRRGALPPNAEVAVRGTVEPILLKGGGTVKSLSAAFLADLEQDWLAHGKEIFPVLREKYPQAYFQGIVSLARIIRWEVGPAGTFVNRALPKKSWTSWRSASDRKGASYSSNSWPRCIGWSSSRP